MNQNYTLDDLQEPFIVGRAETRTLIHWGRDVTFIYILVLPDGFLFKSYLAKRLLKLHVPASLLVLVEAEMAVRVHC